MTTDFESVGYAFYRPLNSSHVSSTTPVEDSSLGYDPNGKIFVQDTEVMDDMCLILRTELGPIVILGCAHRGLINSLKHAMSLTKSDFIYMVIGGTHLSGVPEQRLRKTVQALNEMNVQKIGVSHCTGQIAAAYLCTQLGESRFFFNNAGSVIRFRNGKLQIDKF